MKKSIGSGRGSVYNIILKALQSGDKYGYEICKEVEDKTNGAYILKQPSLYSGLKRLEAQGDVKSYWKDSALGGRRHYYSLTESGKSRIEGSDFNWQDARDDIVDTLFEKSEYEKTIKSAESDIDYIRSSNSLNEQTQKYIDEILTNTEYLTKQTENNQNQQEFEDKTFNVNENFEENNDYKKQETVDYSAGDLFSMFNTVSKNEESNKIDIKEPEYNYETDTVDTVENIENIENIKDDVFDNDDTKFETQEQNKQLDLFSFFNNSQTFKENLAKSGQDIPSEEMNEDTKNSNDFSEIEDNLKTINDNEVNSKIDSHDEEMIIFDNDKNKKINEELENKIESKNDFQINEKLLENNDELDDENIELIFEGNNEEKEDNKEIADSLNPTLTNEEVVIKKSGEEEVIIEKNESDIFAEYQDNNINYDTYLDDSIKKDIKGQEELNNEAKKSEDFPSINQLDDVNKNNSEVKKDEIEENIEFTNQDNKLPNVESDNKFKQENEKSEKIKENSFVDYKNIFGDLISPQTNLDNNIELDDEFVYNNTNDSQNILENNDKIEENFDNNIITEQKQASNNEVVSKELPRNDDAIKDINRTLMFDTSIKKDETFYASSNFEKYDQTPFNEANGFDDQKQKNNPFEKYDSYQKIDEVKPEKQTYYDYQSARISNLAFDKKYANAYNRFEVPDYEVRYFRKNNASATASKFLSINKLNLTNSFILSILICIITTLCLIFTSIKGQLSGFQMFIYILSYLICFGTLFVNFFKYHLNKNKKVQKLKKPETMYIAFIAIVMIILSIAVNLLAGMNFENIAGYTASFVLPIFYALVLLINYPLKKFLSKFSSFYN